MTVAEIREIKDPVERVTAAAELARTAEAAADTARGKRDQAAVVAHLDHGVAAVTLYRDVLGVSRSLFVRIMQRAPAERLPIPNAIEKARKYAATVKDHEAIAQEAREIRDETAMLLMNGGTDSNGVKVTPVANADVARATGLTTARVAQMRTGTR